MKLLLSLLLFSSSSFAVNLSDYSPYNYEVLFTNPTCKTYFYETPLESVDSKRRLKSKTKNAYCKPSDKRSSVKRKNSPEKRLIDWIRDSETKEIVLHYLSFSNSSIARELCNAIKKRNIKVTLVIDNNNKNDSGRMAKANMIKNCRPSRRFGDNSNPSTVLTRGGDGAGRKKTGYAHNKLFFVNPNSKGKVKIAFSSGNMSSGTSTHHENWHFITTNARSYFSQVHKCLINGVSNHYQDTAIYAAFIKSCRAEINVSEEDDIKVFFIPGNGKPAINAIKKAISKSKSVDLAAHRFSYGKLIKTMEHGLSKKITMRLVVDDDMYWAGIYKKSMGRNTTFERRKITSLERKGLQVKYVETYADDIFEPRSLQLQHNKYLIFNYSNTSGAVFTGAGNLTTAAFTKNFENFYFISIPEVYQAFKKQYKYKWEKLSRGKNEMPKVLELP